MRKSEQQMAAETSKPDSSKSRGGWPGWTCPACGGSMVAYRSVPNGRWLVRYRQCKTCKRFGQTRIPIDPLTNRHLGPEVVG
jgi:ssDNA-binding Zn-finger/Zn-ribbon topoisomerase 1